MPNQDNLQYNPEDSRLRELKEALTFEEVEKPYVEEEEEPGEPPMPTAEQTALWAEIEKRATVDNLITDSLLLDLSVGIQYYLASEAVAQKIGEIASRRNFDRDRARIVAKSVLDLFLGVISLSDFIDVLSMRLNVDLETAKAATKDIADGVLAPVKEELKKIHQIKS